MILAAMSLIFFGCNEKNTNDAESLFSEIDMDAPLNTLSKSEKKAGWELLFDGNDLDGWHGYNMDESPESWKVQDGILKIINEGGAENAGGLVTDKIFGSFALYLEFQLTPAANSGILYHVKEDPKYTYAYETGTEYQLIDQEGWPDPLEDWQVTGANYAMHPPMVKPYKPVGDWNQAFLLVDGNKVTHMLNGKLIVQFEKYSDDWNKLRNSGKWSDFPDYGKFDEGNICLQNHGTIVHFRNIKIREL